MPRSNILFCVWVLLKSFIFTITFILTEVNEVVDAILYLLSDKASMINGICLPVDGGRTVQ